MREVLLALGVTGIVAALIWAVQLPFLVAVGLWCALLVIGIVFERVRYKPIEEGAPGPGWSRTEESFVDPETGRRVVVFFNAQTGERRYVGQGR